MTNLKHTKKALLSSIIALVLCFAMLLGTTYAWFTDSATSSGNKIQAGTLDVDLYLWTSQTVSSEITDESDPIFGVNTKALNGTNTLWEPGKTQTVYLSIKNNGNLDLKYKVALDVKNPDGGQNLYEVMEYAITPDAKYGEVSGWGSNGTKVVPGLNDTKVNSELVNDVALKAGEEHFFALSIHMDELAGNTYKSGSVEFDIKVLAGQLASELDSFGNSYDKLAGYPGTGYADAEFEAPENGTKVLKESAEIQITGDVANGENGYKVGSLLMPAGVAFDESVDGISADISKTNYNGNFTIAAGLEHTSYEVSVEGISENNTVPVKVQLRIPAGLDPETVSLYHYDAEVTNAIYDPNSGYVIFETTSFSPFTIVYDAESEYVAPEIPKDEENNAKYPTANVTYAPDYVGEGKVTWGSYGQWSPTVGLDSALEAAFIFKCPDYESASEDDKAVIEAFRHWYCDFYVSLDRDLGENQIFLGGYYAQFGAYVGFHNGTVTLKANEELPLLGSVVTNEWTYSMVEQSVGEFMCGVGDVNDALNGATFTVKLRLTNPENEAEFYDVNVVTHTFGGNSVIDGVTVDLDAN